MFSTLFATALILVFQNCGRIANLGIPTSENLANNYDLNSIIVLGQPDLDGESNLPNAGGKSLATLNEPRGVFVDASGRLLVADTGNHRILVWNRLPQKSFTGADVEIGNSKARCADAQDINETTLCSPKAIWINDKTAFISDSGSNRVLVWESFPQKSGAPVFALGQPDLSANQPNQGFNSPTDFTLNHPLGICSNGQRLFVTDSQNNRVLVWQLPIFRHQQAASWVLGQPNLGSNSANAPDISAGTLSSPYGIYCDSKQLLVSDQYNHRILKWTLTEGEVKRDASAVIGQPDFITNIPNLRGVGPTTLNFPTGLFFSDTQTLWVADQSNHRLLGWKGEVINSGLGEPANFIYGQVSFSASEPNNSPHGSLQDVFHSPAAIWCGQGRCVLADKNNNRVLIIPETRLAAWGKVGNGL